MIPANPSPKPRAARRAAASATARSLRLRSAQGRSHRYVRSPYRSGSQAGDIGRPYRLRNGCGSRRYWHRRQPCPSGRQRHCGQAPIEHREKSPAAPGASSSFLHPGHGPQRPDWLADDAVSCELVSAPNSLLTGKLTGNFADSGSLQRFWRSVSERIQ